MAIDIPLSAIGAVRFEDSLPSEAISIVLRLCWHEIKAAFVRILNYNCRLLITSALLHQDPNFLKHQAERNSLTRNICYETACVGTVLISLMDCASRWETKFCRQP